MEWIEALGYVFTIGYIAFGLGYFLRRGLTAVNYDPTKAVIHVIGTEEIVTVNIDYLFEESGIPQIDSVTE